jgi:hypothetical protein
MSAATIFGIYIVERCKRGNLQRTKWSFLVDLEIDDANKNVYILVDRLTHAAHHDNNSHYPDSVSLIIS